MLWVEVRALPSTFKLSAKSECSDLSAEIRLGWSSRRDWRGSRRASLERGPVHEALRGCTRKRIKLAVVQEDFIWQVKTRKANRNAQGDVSSFDQHTTAASRPAWLSHVAGAGGGRRSPQISAGLGWSSVSRTLKRGSSLSRDTPTSRTPHSFLLLAQHLFAEPAADSPGRALRRLRSV